MDIGCQCQHAYISDECIYPRCYNKRIVKANKNHECIECGEIIHKGEKYESVTGIWEKWEHIKTCIICTKIRDDIFCDGYSIIGELRYDIKELYGFDYITEE